jgi:hypothetical protein
MFAANVATGSALLPSPLRGEVGSGGAKQTNLSWGPPSLTLPRKGGGNGGSVL